VASELSDDYSIPLIGGLVPVEGEPDNDIRGGSVKTDAVVDRVSITKLQAQIEKLAQLVRGDSLTAATSGGFAAEEIKIVAEITASGELGFLVAGAELEAKGSIEITFRRSGK
jgi:hypothetical protein